MRNRKYRGLPLMVLGALLMLAALLAALWNLHEDRLAGDGAAALLTGDAQTDALAKAAAAFLAQDAQVQQILGERGIEEDGAVWLPAVGAHPQGTLLSTLLCDALRGTLMEGRSAASAMRGVTQALDAAR